MDELPEDGAMAARTELPDGILGSNTAYCEPVPGYLEIMDSLWPDLSLFSDEQDAPGAQSDDGQMEIKETSAVCKESQEAAKLESEGTSDTYYRLPAEKMKKISILRMPVKMPSPCEEAADNSRYFFSPPLNLKLPRWRSGAAPPVNVEEISEPSGPDIWKCRACGEANWPESKACRWCLFARPDKETEALFDKILKAEEVVKMDQGMAEEAVEKWSEGDGPKKLLKEQNAKKRRRVTKSSRKVMAPKGEKPPHVGKRRSLEKVETTVASHKRSGAKVKRRCKICFLLNEGGDRCRNCNLSLEQPPIPSITEWRCSRCRVYNARDRAQCICCRGKKADVKEDLSTSYEEQTAAVSSTDLRKLRRWFCTSCFVENFGGNICFACRSEKSGHKYNAISLANAQ